MLAVIRQFRGVMLACVRLDDGECSDKFDLGQGLQQGCVLAPLLLSMFFTTALRVAEKRFFADVAVMDNMAQPQQKKEKEEKKDKPRADRVDGQGEEEEEEAQML